jgi:restriction system protein
MEAIIIIFMIVVAVIIVRIFAPSSSQKAIEEQISFPSDYKVSDISIAEIDKMLDGSDFEMYLYRLFLELNYDGVYKTVGARDFGADIVFTDSQGHRNVIQAKRYSVTNQVGLSAVQEIYTSMKFYKARKSIVITSSFYTEACETLAGVNWVKLLDRKDLIQIIEFYKSGQLQKAKELIESEPRKIYESWAEMNDSYREIKKDKKAEKAVNACK